MTHLTGETPSSDPGAPVEGDSLPRSSREDAVTPHDEKPRPELPASLASDEVWSLTPNQNTLNLLVQSGRKWRTASIQEVFYSDSADQVTECLERIGGLGKDDIASTVRDFKRHGETLYYSFKDGLLPSGTQIVPLPRGAQEALSWILAPGVAEWLASRSDLNVTDDFNAQFVRSQLPSVFDERTAGVSSETVEALILNWCGTIGDLVEACGLVQ